MSETQTAIVDLKSLTTAEVLSRHRQVLRIIVALLQARNPVPAEE